MVARINVGKNLYDVPSYDQNRVDEGGAEVLSTHFLRCPEDRRFRPGESARQFLEWMPNHYRTGKPVVCISLNPRPDDVSTDGQLAEIGRECMQRLGYDSRLYLVFKHGGIGRYHIHIVSLYVDNEGGRVPDKFEYRRNKGITEPLGQRYGLYSAEDQEKGEEWQLKPVDVAEGDIKRQIVYTIEPLIRLYRLRTMGELRALLFLYNIGMEEAKGEIGGHTYHGILCTALDGSGGTAATSIKFFQLGRTTGTQQLDKKMQKSAAKIKPDPCREQLRSLMAGILYQSVGERDFRDCLAKEQIDSVPRRNETDRIYGVTFIDHRSRAVLNDSRPGKEFSVDVFNGHFWGQPPNSLSPLLPLAPSTVTSGDEEKVPGGLLSGMEPELNYISRHPRLLRPDKRKRRQRYGRQD